ncbi:HD-GYP domain-containing protein [Clostridium peptidivorans]|uniref:HD-GYP domain-containing protein n=1 Tax=Clostridium peptidivorans TaxID=100174 RepID=UPI000BE399BC|nr:HD-GYP domain-containing protein [Clostridium peptidivorans]
MNEIIFSKDDPYIEKISKKSQEVSLVATGDETEVMIHKIQADTKFILFPGESESLMEFFYVVDGMLSTTINSKHIFVNENEYFNVKGLKESIYFKAEANTTLLCVSSQLQFHYLSNEISELNVIVEKVSEKDMYTQEHNLRLQDYSIRIAKELKLHNKTLYNLLYASLFHDIGKINVPIEVLNKPGRLTKEEFDYIKKHPEDGYDLMKNSCIQEVGEIIRQHHERLDGSGYPHGLKEDEICIEAKIIAVVDTYDAMTSDRPYRKALSPIIAMDELKRLKGIHYDEKIVDIFEQILMKEEKI